MRIAVCGKGGAGKSTISTLISRGLAEMGCKVILMDADESNFGLARLMGVDPPMNLMESMGGKKGLKQKMGRAFRDKEPVDYLNKELTSADFPESCVAESDGVRLVIIGKIHDFGEGCACPIGVLSRKLLGNLHLEDDEIVVIDTEAGVEQFGRGLGEFCDLILGVVDPTYESFQLAEKMEAMAGKAAANVYFVENRVNDSVKEVMDEALDRSKVAASIPDDQTWFMDSLKGRKISSTAPQIAELCQFIKTHWKTSPAGSKPVIFNMG